jgi:hypothetical protein
VTAVWQPLAVAVFTNLEDIFVDVIIRRHNQIGWRWYVFKHSPGEVELRTMTRTKLKCHFIRVISCG